MSMIFPLLILIAANAAAVDSPCVLLPKLVDAYSGSASNLENIATAHHAIGNLMQHCPRGPIDGNSRKTFFEILDREFHLNYASLLQNLTAPDRAAADEGVGLFQAEVINYLDNIVSRDDFAYNSTIVLVGTGKAISILGPAVREEVVRLSTNPDVKTVGFWHNHYPQAAAFETLGLWIDPGE